MEVPIFLQKSRLHVEGVGSYFSKKPTEPSCISIRVCHPSIEKYTANWRSKRTCLRLAVQQ